MREATIEQRVCEIARANGWLTRKWQSVSFRSVPDRLFFKGGRVVIVEFKAPGKRPTRAQDYEHKKLKEHGFDVHVIDSIEAGAALFGRAA